MRKTVIWVRPHVKNQHFEFCFNLACSKLTNQCDIYRGGSRPWAKGGPVNTFLTLALSHHFVSGWKPWSSWSRCNKNCDVGEQFRTRECVNKECDGSSRESRKCNEFECYGEVSFVLRSGLQISTSGNVWRTDREYAIWLLGQLTEISKSKVILYYLR